MAIRFIRTPTGIIRYDNNFTDEQKRKLLNIEWGAQVNTVLGVKGSNESKWRIGYIEINKDNVGLGRADNTPDVEKNVFSATRLTTGRDITIGNKTVNFNGTVNIGYTLREIGAVNRAGDTMTGKLTGTIIEAPSLIGELTGNSSSATKLKTGRDITIGDKTVNFDGTKNIGYTIREIGATRRDGDTIIGTYTFDMTTMDKSINIASIPVNKYGIHLGSILGTGLYLVANSSGKGIIINTNGESIGLDINVSSDNSCGIKISNETDAYSIYSVGKNYLGVLTAKSLSVTDGIHATDLAVPINFTIGNKTISFNGASAMNYTLKDIGAVNRAGDTMTGKLTGTVIEAPSLIGELTGNASSATKLKTGRDITIGNRTVNFDGTSNISYTLAQIGAVNRAGDTMTGALTGTTITANSFVGPLTGNASTATKLAAGRDITIGNRTVNFDGSANIGYTLAQIGAVNRAGDTMTGKLTGTVIEAPSLIGELTGNASSATKFKKAMKLTIGNKTYDLDGSTDLVYTFNDVGYLTSDTKYAASDTVGGAAKNLNYFLTTATTSLGLEQSVNAIGYVSNVNILGQNDGALIVQRYSDSWKAEIFIDYRTGQMATRGKNNGTWKSWRTQLDSGNYGSYAVPLAGGTMTGALTGTTITANSFVGPLTGNASTATKLQTARTIALSGSVTGSANFDGSGNITISTSTNHNHDSLYLKLTGGTMSGNLSIVNTSPVLTIKNSGGNDTSLVFDRNANANWKILNSNGRLYFQTDFTSSKQSSYHTVMTLDFSNNSVNASKFVGPIIGEVTGNASTATKLKTARTITLSGAVTGSVSFDGSANVTLSTSVNHTHSYLPLAGGTMTGNIEFSNSGTTSRGVIGTVGDNDYWRIIGGATTNNAGFLEISTADDGSEPIYVRQYSSGKFVTLKRTLTLLDGNGNSSFPGTVTAPTFSGSLSGNATSASYVKLTTNGSQANLSFCYGSYSGSSATVNLLYFSELTTVDAISSSQINAGTATKLKTARTITLSGAVTGSVSFDGSANVTLSTSVNHTHSYLPLAGGTMTGTLLLKGNVYDDAYTGALNAQNSNIYNLNALYFADVSDSAAEGIHFYRDNTHTDTLWAQNGVLYFSPNRLLGGSSTNYSILTTGNYTSYAMPKTWANNTLYTIGDDVSMGDGNVSGCLVIKGLNGASGIQFNPYSGSTSQKITINGSGTMTITGTVASTFSGNLSGNATSATKLKTARTITLSGSVTGSANFDGSGNITISTSTNHTHSYLPLSGGTMTGDIIFGNMTTSSDTTRGIKATISGSDGWGIVGHSVGSDNSYLEIYTSDNASEGILVRQYNSSSYRTAYLLTAQGNTTFPGTVTAPTFIGNLSGNATSAGQLSDTYNTATRTVSLNAYYNSLLPSDDISLGNSSNKFGLAYIAGIVLNDNSSLGIKYGKKKSSDGTSQTGMLVGDTSESGNASYTIISQDCVMTNTCKINRTLHSCNIMPQINNTYNLGTNGSKWVNIYATNGTIQTSDERLKNIKGSITDDYKELITSITPMMYTFKNKDGEKEHDRIHMGFSAQEVKRIMDKVGITDKEFAGYCRDDIYPIKEVIDSDGKTQHISDKTKDPVDYALSLRYGEFIPIITAVLQDVIKENKELKERLDRIEAKQ